MKSAYAFCMVAAVALSGCATVTRGTDDVLQVVTQPAGAQVQTSNGYSCKATPCEIKMPRKSEFVATITHPKCRPAQVKVSHQTADAGAAGVAGNILVGGVIGLAVDASSGASQELVPNPVDVKLQCRR